MPTERLVAGGIFRVRSYFVGTAALKQFIQKKRSARGLRNQIVHGVSDMLGRLVRWELYSRVERAASTSSWLQLPDYDPCFRGATGNLARNGAPEPVGSLGMRTEPVPIDLFGKINRRQCRSSDLVDNQHCEPGIARP